MSTRTVSSYFQGASGKPPSGARVDIELAGPVLKEGVSFLAVASIALTVAGGDINPDTGYWQVAVVDTDTTGQAIRVRESVNGAAVRTTAYEIPAGSSALDLRTLIPVTAAKPYTPFLTERSHREDVTSEYWGHENASTTLAGFMSSTDKGRLDDLWGGLVGNAGFTPDQTGGVNRPISAKLNEILSVKDFGAVGNGIANDTAAIQAALNTGKRIYIPSGTYKITAGLLLVGDQEVFGDGIGKTVISCSRASSTDSYNVLTNYNYPNGSSANQTFHIHDLTLAANCQSLTDIGGASHTIGANGIALNRVEKTVIERVEVKDTGLNGIAIFDTEIATVRDCRLLNIGWIPFPNTTDYNWSTKASGNGITFTGYGGGKGLRLVMENCTVENVRDVAMNSWKLSRMTISNCHHVGHLSGVATVNTRGGFSVEAGGADGDADNCAIINCSSRDTANGILVENSKYSKIIGCNVISTSSLRTNGIIYHKGSFGVIQNNYVEGFINTGGTGISLGNAGSGETKNTLVTGNTLKGNYHGIRAYSARESVIANNIIEGASVGGSGINLSLASGSVADTYRVKVNGNLIMKAKSEGIHVNSNYGAILENNTILGATNAGIRVNASNDVRIMRNVIDQYDASTKVVYTIMFENNPSNCVIADNILKNFTGAESSIPFGMLLASTGTPPLVYHRETDRHAPTLNGILAARSGSIIYTLNEGSGNVSKNVKTTDTSSTGWVGEVYTPMISGSSAPSSGTFNKGDYIRNSDPDVGEPFAWVCTVSGTFGTYSEGRTATADGTSTIILSGASTVLKRGQWISVGGGAARRIDAINGTSVTLNGTVGAGSGLAIAYSAPTIRALANVS